MTTSPTQRTRDDWLDVLRRNRIRPEKAMGQNFLVEPEAVEEIVAIAGVVHGDVVVEIGPGMGILTRELASTGARVIAIELDRELARFLAHDLAGLTNVQVIEGDALAVDVGNLVGSAPFQVVANLPYSTGTPIVRRFLTMAPRPSQLTVMLQREVAERMVAEPPGMSLLTLAIRIQAEASIEMIVPPNLFVPPPKVDSAVVRLVPRPVPIVDPNTEAAVFRIATMAFQRKRKTVSNGLAQGLGRSKTEVDAILSEAGVDPTHRPQTLSLDDWVRITKAIES